MGAVMARELVDAIQVATEGSGPSGDRPGGPSCWYAPFTERVNRENVSLERLVVFHMDECLDWQGRELRALIRIASAGTWRNILCSRPGRPRRAREESALLAPGNVETIRRDIAAAPIDLTYGGWGQDGTSPTIRPVAIPTAASASMNCDARRAGSGKQPGYHSGPGQRTSAAPTSSCRPCPSPWESVVPLAKRVRLFSDHGGMETTALRVALSPSPRRNTRSPSFRSTPTPQLRQPKRQLGIHQPASGVGSGVE